MSLGLVAHHLGNLAALLEGLGHVLGFFGNIAAAASVEIALESLSLTLHVSLL